MQWRSKGGVEGGEVGKEFALLGIFQRGSEEGVAGNFLCFSPSLRAGNLFDVGAQRGNKLTGPSRGPKGIVTPRV